MRNTLASTLFQYGTKFQTFKHTALDRIVERIIFTSNNKFVEIKEIQEAFQKDIGYILPFNIFEESIKRLLELKRIEPLHESMNEYKLAEKTFAELNSIQSNFDRNLYKITDKLFSNAPERKELLMGPFWFAMTYIFSNLGKYSAKLIEGQLDKETFIKPVLTKCCEKIKEKFDINNEYFEKRILYFFEETKEPLFNSFKWSIAQNYFIANSLGLNLESENLTADIFKNSILYIDTNILLSLVSNNNQYYNNAISFINAAKKIDLSFCISELTLIEYYSWVNGEKQRILETRNQIPEATKKKVGSVLYRDYLECINKSSEKELVIDEIVEKYLDIKTLVGSLIPQDKIIFLVEDDWFTDIESKDVFTKTREDVIEKYKLTGVRTKKGENAATHDAKILLWIDNEKQKLNKNIWFITADSSLPLITINGAEKSDSILLDVILQWLVPLTRDNGKEEYQEAFSEILRNKLLPKDILFEVKDFIIFEELHMECAELPSEDVEECIIYLKKNAPNLNPNNPLDREKLANKIAVYFADPGRKYKKELSEKLEENEELKKQLGDVHVLLKNLELSNKEKDEKIVELQGSHSKELHEIRKSHSEQESIFNEKLSNIQKQLTSYENNQINNEIDKNLKAWKRPGKFSFYSALSIFCLGIFEILPNWSWNYPAKIVEYLNSIESTDKTRFRILITVNITILTTLIIALSAFSYKRLWDKRNIEKTRNELLNEKRNASKVS